MTTNEFIEKIKNLKDGEWCGCFDWEDTDQVDFIGQWHDVKDKLPDKDGEYLVYGTGSPYYKYIIVCNYRKGHKQLTWSVEEEDGFRTIEVTHWMELPEPPHDK